MPLGEINIQPAQGGDVCPVRRSVRDFMNSASAPPSPQISPAEHPALVAAIAQKRDRAAFAVLFDFYAPRITSYYLRLRVERASAEEMTQDVMVTLWHKANLFDPSRSSLATWLYRIARNRRIDLMRRSRVDYVDPSGFGLDILDESVVEADTMLVTQQRDESLRSALASLPAEQMQLVQLSFFDSLTHAEIAQKTGLPLGTIKSRIRLAFTRLRRTLESSGIISPL